MKPRTVQALILPVWLVLTFWMSTAAAQLDTDASGEFWWVVTSAEPATGAPVVFGVQNDGSAVSVLCIPDGIPEGRIISSPAVRVDGKMLFHTVTSSGAGGSLFLGRINNRHIRPLALTYADQPAGPVRWSVDGNGALFSNNSSGIHRMDLNPNTLDETILTGDEMDELAAAGGAAIYFNNAENRLPQHAFTMDAAGNNLLPWDLFGNQQTVVGDLSPDGSLILAGDLAAPGIWIAKPDKSWKFKIANTGAVADGGAAWGPDSATVAFIDAGNIWAVRTDGAGLTQLTHGEIANPRVWSYHAKTQSAEGEGEGEGEEGEGEGENEDPWNCAYRDIFDAEWLLLAEYLGLPQDDEVVFTDTGQIPERWGLAMVRMVLCKDSHPWHLSAMDGYLFNVAALEAEPAGGAAVLAPFKHVVAALLMVNQNRQDRLKETLGLVNAYAIVRSTAKTGDEIFDDLGDLDGDGATNLQEYNNIIAWGGGIEDFAEAAALADWWQGEAMPAAAFPALLALAALLTTAALLAAYRLSQS